MLGKDFFLILIRSKEVYVIHSGAPLTEHPTARAYISPHKKPYTVACIGADARTLHQFLHSWTKKSTANASREVMVVLQDDSYIQQQPFQKVTLSSAYPLHTMCYQVLAERSSWVCYTYEQTFYHPALTSALASPSSHWERVDRHSVRYRERAHNVLLRTLYHSIFSVWVYRSSIVPYVNVLLKYGEASSSASVASEEGAHSISLLGEQVGRLLDNPRRRFFVWVLYTAVRKDRFLHGIGSSYTHMPRYAKRLLWIALFIPLGAIPLWVYSTFMMPRPTMQSAVPTTPPSISSRKATSHRTTPSTPPWEPLLYSVYEVLYQSKLQNPTMDQLGEVTGVHVERLQITPHQLDIEGKWHHTEPFEVQYKEWQQMLGLLHKKLNAVRIEVKQSPFRGKLTDNRRVRISVYRKPAAL